MKAHTPTVHCREIKRYQKSVNHLIAKVDLLANNTTGGSVAMPQSVPLGDKGHRGLAQRFVQPCFQVDEHHSERVAELEKAGRIAYSLSNMAVTTDVCP